MACAGHHHETQFALANYLIDFRDRNGDIMRIMHEIDVRQDTSNRRARVFAATYPHATSEDIDIFKDTLSELDSDHMDCWIQLVYNNFGKTFDIHCWPQFAGGLPALNIKVHIHPGQTRPGMDWRRPDIRIVINDHDNWKGLALSLIHI